MSAALRSLLRFHLLTLIAMALAAGAILWANISEHAAPSPLNGTWRGFPFPMCSRTHSIFAFVAGDNVILWKHDSYARIGPFRFHYNTDGWSFGLVALNMLIGIVGVSVVAICSEYILRRRKGRSP